MRLGLKGSLLRSGWYYQPNYPRPARTFDKSEARLSPAKITSWP